MARVRVLRALASVWLGAHDSVVILADGRQRDRMHSSLFMSTPWVVEVLEVFDGDVVRDDEGHTIVLAPGGGMLLAGQCEVVNLKGPNCAPGECIPLAGMCPPDTVPRRADEGRGPFDAFEADTPCTDCSGPVVDPCCFPFAGSVAVLFDPDPGFEADVVREVDLTALSPPPATGFATFYRLADTPDPSRWPVPSSANLPGGERG